LAAADPDPDASAKLAAAGGTTTPRGLTKLVVWLDLIGVFVFALEGALAAREGHFDVFGVLVLSFTTALGGGIVRDLLIGAHPVAAIRDWRYPALAFSAGALVFAFQGLISHEPSTLLLVLDALGLSLFAIAGAEKALAYRVHPSVAVLLAAVTGVGGGCIRDILMNRSPGVLHTDIYAVAALFGATVMVIAQRRLSLSPSLAGFLGGAACFTLRMLAVWQHWQLPQLS
jgi:uncharacterized membrane protein YeiH